MAAAAEEGLPSEQGAGAAVHAPSAPASTRKAAEDTMLTPRRETVRLTRHARERVTPRNPKLHQFSNSARLQKELLAASQMMPEPEPELEPQPEFALRDPVVTKKMSLAEQRANVKRNPVMKAQTPRLRAQAVAKAAVESQWPSKNVSAPRRSARPPGHLTERADAEEQLGLCLGRPAGGRSDELAQRVPMDKLAEILGGLQKLSDNPVVQRALENSIAGHSGLYIPKRERTNVRERWSNARRELRKLVQTKQAFAIQKSADGRTMVVSQDRTTVLSTDHAGSDLAASIQSGADHDAFNQSQPKSMFERISVVSNAQGAPKSGTVGWNSGSRRKNTAIVPALPALAPTPPQAASTGTAASHAVGQLRGLLQVHPATTHKNFTADHLKAINRLIVDGMAIQPNAVEPALSVRASSALVTSSIPREFENICAGDRITIIIDGQPVRRTVLVEEETDENIVTVEAQLPADAVDNKPRMSRAILKAIFEQLDQNGDGVVDEQELLHSVAADETLAQLLHMPPMSPQDGGRSSDMARDGQTFQDDVATVQAVMTDIVKTNKKNHDAEMKAAMIDLVSPWGGQEGRASSLNARGSPSSLAEEKDPPSIAHSSLAISTAAMSIPDRDVLETMEPDAVRKLALDLGISPDQVGAAAPPCQVGFEEFAQFLESLVASTGANRSSSWAARTSPRGRPDTPDTLQVDAPFCDKALDGVTYSVSRHLRPVAEWGLDVDLPGVDRQDGITWEAVGVLPPQIRSDIAQEEVEASMLLAQLTPRMQTINRDKAGRISTTEPGRKTVVQPVARPPKDQRVYKGPASLRGRRMRPVGAPPVKWKC